LDKATQSQLDRGYRMVEILKQPQFKPMNVVDQVMIIYAGTKGYLDKVPAKDVRAWEEQFLRYMRERQPEVGNAIRKERKLSKEIEQQLTAAITNFQAQFKPAGPSQRSDAIKAPQDQVKAGR
jgi:F-type H+-transporting ATPase subunit alpha